MNRTFFISALGALLFFSVISQAQAAGQYGCSSQYGDQCPTQEFSISKFVKDPQTKEYVDTLESNGHKFSPENAVSFKLTVKNTGSQTLTNLKVEDTFPDLVTFISGPGTFDNNTKVLSFEIDKLGSGESKDFIIQGKTASAAKLPANEGLVCVVNQATVKLNGMVSTDNAQLCIEKQVLPGTTKGGLKVFPAPKTKETPPTGPEALALIGLLPGGILGLFLRKKAGK